MYDFKKFSRDQRRLKRDITFDTHIVEHMNDNNLHILSRRLKRDSLTHVENVMKGIEHKLNGLQVKILQSS